MIEGAYQVVDIKEGEFDGDLEQTHPVLDTGAVVFAMTP